MDLNNQKINFSKSIFIDKYIALYFISHFTLQYDNFIATIIISSFYHNVEEQKIT